MKKLLSINLNAIPNYFCITMKSLPINRSDEMVTTVRIVDESCCVEAPVSMGTHKRHFALFVAKLYREYATLYPGEPLKITSLLSSGSAALEFHRLFSKYHLPPVRCLISDETQDDIKQRLIQNGVKFYEASFKQKLSSEDILNLTDNAGGWEATGYHFPGITVNTKEVYGFLSYEILFERPDIVITPYGSGLLFENLLFHQELIYEETQKKCTIIGMGTEDPYSFCSSKLFALYRLNSEGFVKGNGVTDQSGIFGIDDDVAKNAFDYLKCHGFSCENSAVAGLAGLFQLQDKVDLQGKNIIVIMTGNSMT